MADDYSMAEVVRRLQSVEQLLREQARGMVPVELYARDRAEWERRVGAAERGIDEERRARKDAVKEVREELGKQAEKQSGTWRQALFGGVVPGAIVLISVAVNIVLAARGGK